MLSPWDALTKLFWLSAGPRAHRRLNPGTLEPQPFLTQSRHQSQVELGLAPAVAIAEPGDTPPRSSASAPWHHGVNAATENFSVTGENKKKILLCKA